MAANFYNPPDSAANLVEIYNDAPAPAPSRGSAVGLHSQGCNFIDTALGANATRCGCRRFWPRQSLRSPVYEQAGWCMCNHHACFHDDADHMPPPETTNFLGQENERPPTDRQPLSPMVDVPLNLTTNVPGMSNTSFGAGAPHPLIHTRADGTGHLAPGPSSQHISSMPDTLPWGDLINSQPANFVLPPIPSQCLMSSQTASTASSVQGRNLRPFAGKGLHTLSAVRGQHPTSSDSRPSHAALTHRGEGEEAESSFIFVNRDVAATPRSGTATQVEPRVIGSDSVSRDAFKNLSETVTGHEKRLDRLETVSFSATGQEDCGEKHDHMDLRVTELENRMDEMEKTASERREERNDDATQSIASFSTNATSRPFTPQALWSQIQLLNARMSHLESFHPSQGRPWEVEVVFLPFPLKKVWQELNQFKLDPSTSNDDWTQLPMTHSTATMRSQSPFCGEWTAPDHDADWLLPKACGVNTTIDKRLRSRGLVKKVSVRSPDARGVQLAIHSAFGEIFREMNLAGRTSDSDPRTSRFTGLHSNWVPLRKIHKDSRLRFLTGSEMTTQTLWDVQFLNSVMMRSSEPRLFITHPDAYLQDQRAYESGWTWQSLREMSRVYPESEGSQEVPEADALEGHWSWSELLDAPPGMQSSIIMQRDGRRVSISPSAANLQDGRSWRSPSPMVVAGEPSMLKGRRAPRPPHIRTISMPVSGPARTSPAINSARRVASHGHSRRSSPAIRALPQTSIQKRRATRSPSHPRFTPRWTASPSPMALALYDRPFARGTTPFAYATPHSNAPLQEIRPVRGSSAMRELPMEFMPMDDGDDEYDDDFEIQIYESGEEESFDDGESMDSVDVTHAQPRDSYESQNPPLPEDEPWPGIEDQDHVSGAENMDPDDALREQPDHRSNASSQPSEYPSTQTAWPQNTGGPGFHIHEDE